MFTKILNFIFGCSVFVGFFVILGTAGASDLNKIDIDTILFQSFLALLMIGFGFVGLKVNNREID